MILYSRQQCYIWSGPVDERTDRGVALRDIRGIWVYDRTRHNLSYIRRWPHLLKMHWCLWELWLHAYKHLTSICTASNPAHNLDLSHVSIFTSQPLSCLHVVHNLDHLNHCCSNIHHATNAINLTARIKQVLIKNYTCGRLGSLDFGPSFSICRTY
jgi:hypothetical protein